MTGIQMVRPPWREVVDLWINSADPCSCGLKYCDVDELARHWQAGHFDYMPDHNSHLGATEGG
jgi:hypothetical protein